MLRGRRKEAKESDENGDLKDTVAEAETEAEEEEEDKFGEYSEEAFAALYPDLEADCLRIGGVGDNLSRLFRGVVPVLFAEGKLTELLELTGIVKFPEKLLPVSFTELLSKSSHNPSLKVAEVLLFTDVLLELQEVGTLRFSCISRSVKSNVPFKKAAFISSFSSEYPVEEDCLAWF